MKWHKIRNPVCTFVYSVSMKPYCHETEASLYFVHKVLDIKHFCHYKEESIC